MQEHRILKQGAGSWFLLWVGILAFGSFAQAQTLDEVHVTPQKEPGPPASIVDVAPLDRLPTLDAHMKPLRVDVDRVLVPVTVTDARNRPVTTLKKQDFVLYEQEEQQEIRYFSAEEAPISIAVLVDVSKSMADKVDTERAAITEFFNNANPEDEYFAITFSDRPRLLASASRSIDEIERKLRAAEPGGPTAMLDAVYLAVTKLRSARYDRRAIVIISDGGDNASRYSLREVKNLVQESDVEIYAIGLFDTFFFNTIEEKFGKKWLSDITDITGGRTITVDNRSKLPAAAATISREMRNQYVLGYKPTSAGDGKWRKIRVRVSSPTVQEHLQAYYKKGYVATQR